jgi:hypothetical protein
MFVHAEISTPCRTFLVDAKMMVHFNDNDTYKYTGDTATHYGGTQCDLPPFDESSILKQNMAFS